MATQTITIRRRTRRTGGNSGYKKCPNCGGDGRVKIRTSPKSKSSKKQG